MGARRRLPFGDDGTADLRSKSTTDSRDDGAANALPTTMVDECAISVAADFAKRRGTTKIEFHPDWVVFLLAAMVAPAARPALLPAG